MNNLSGKNKAQAIAEMAILAVLLLVVFSAIISYGQRYDRMQQAKMTAFRKALKHSYDRNAGVTYTIKKDTRGADIFNFGKGSPLPVGSSASVMWQKGGPGTETESSDNYIVGSYSFYEANGRLLGAREGCDSIGSCEGGVQEYSLPRATRTVYTLSHDELDPIVTAASVWKEETRRITGHHVVDQKTEDQAPTITNNAAADLSDQVITTLYFRTDNSAIDPVITDTLGQKPTPVYNYDPSGFGQRTLTVQAKHVVLNDGTDRGDIIYCDPNDPNCGSAPAHTQKQWQTAN
jgi:hypothetical protein